MILGLEDHVETTEVTQKICSTAQHRGLGLYPIWGKYSELTDSLMLVGGDKGIYIMNDSGFKHLK